MSSFDRLTQMVMEANNPTYPLTRDSIKYIGVEVDAAARWNTRVTMAAMANSGYTGSVDLFYTRANLTALGTLEFTTETPLTIAQLIDKINAANGSQMSEEDLTNTEVPAMATGVPTSFVIAAAADSLVWLSNAQVRVVTGVPETASSFSDFLLNDAAGLFA